MQCRVWGNRAVLRRLEFIGRHQLAQKREPHVLKRNSVKHEGQVGGDQALYVTVRYAGDTARLDRRKLWEHWALWRNVYFVSSRSGYAAQRFDEFWQEHYGRAYDECGYANADFVPAAMGMPLAEAIALLKVPANFTKDDILAAFRREVKKAHPDVGGTAEMFEALVKARDRLLAALGTNAPRPQAAAICSEGRPTALRQRSTWPRRAPHRLYSAASLSVISRHDGRAEAGLIAVAVLKRSVRLAERRP